MFNFDNVELDFDDDFSSGIFSRGEYRPSADTDNVSHRPNPAPSTARKGPTESPDHPFGEKSPPPLDSPLTGKRSNNTCKRPSLHDQNPHKKRLSSETLLQRKFPGPAGLLPDKPFKLNSDSALPADKSCNRTAPEKDKPGIYSQSSGSVFLDSAYQKLLSDLNLNHSDNPLSRYTVEWVKRTAFTKGLQGRKIPFLGLVVHEVNHSMPDPVLVLRDPTGEISGSLHREVWAEMGGKLREGIALALRQVGVLVTGVIRRQIYLNITMNNILAVYSPSEAKVEITTVNKVPRSELLRSLGHSLPGTAPKQPPTPPFPLATVGHSSRAPAGREEMKVPEGGGAELAGAGTSGRALSRAESLIFEEVLSGIDLDEFDI